MSEIDEGYSDNESDQEAIRRAEIALIAAILLLDVPEGTVLTIDLSDKTEKE